MAEATFQAVLLGVAQRVEPLRLLRGQVMGDTWEQLAPPPEPVFLTGLMGGGQQAARPGTGAPSSGPHPPCALPGPANGRFHTFALALIGSSPSNRTIPHASR